MLVNWLDERDTGKIYEFIDQAVMDGVRDFAKEMRPISDNPPGNPEIKAVIKWCRENINNKIDDLLEKFEEGER